MSDFWRRCRLVHEVRGKTISQLLSSHILVARIQDIGTATAEHFTPEQDQLLLATVARSKRASWAQMARDASFAGHTPKLLKQRWQFLTYEARNREWQSFREAYPFAEEFPFGEAMDILDANPGDDEPDDDDERR